MMQKTQKNIQVIQNVSELHIVRNNLAKILKDSGIKDETAKNLVLAIDEALSAIILYSNSKGYIHDILLSIDIDEVRFKAVVEDPLTTFEVISYEKLLDERNYKMSFHLLCRIMDEVCYTFKKGFENRLELVKFL